MLKPMIARLILEINNDAKIANNFKSQERWPLSPASIATLSFCCRIKGGSKAFRLRLRAC